MEPKISVVIPIYNVEKYLDRCILSVVNQKYVNLEIILVDDGSTDSSGQICDLWERKDKRIVALHKENGGLSDARNFGMERASGDLISFVDSDDYIEEGFFSRLYAVMSKYNADIVECNSVMFYGETCSNYVISDKVVEFSAEDALRELIMQRQFRQTVWNKLYRRNLVTEIFPVGKINEDEYWTYKIFANSDKIAHLDDELYFYFQREDSIMHRKYDVRRIDGVNAQEERMIFLKDKYPSLYSVSILYYLNACIYHFQTLQRNKETDTNKKYRKYLFDKYDKYFVEEYVNTESVKQQIWMKLFRKFPYFTASIRNLLGIGK